jgi:hypothetical protein
MKLHNNIRDNNSPCYDTHVKFFKEGSCEDFLLENNLARVLASKAATTGLLKHATTACPCIEEAALATRGYRHKRKCSEYILSIDERLKDHLLLSSLRVHPYKRINNTKELVPVVFALLNIRQDKEKIKRISVLLDSGASSSVISKNIVKKLHVNRNRNTP